MPGVELASGDAGVQIFACREYQSVEADGGPPGLWEDERWQNKAPPPKSCRGINSCNVDRVPPNEFAAAAAGSEFIASIAKKESSESWRVTTVAKVEAEAKAD